MSAFYQVVQVGEKPELGFNPGTETVLKGETGVKGSSRLIAFLKDQLIFYTNDIMSILISFYPHGGFISMLH